MPEVTLPELTLTIGCRASADLSARAAETARQVAALLESRCSADSGAEEAADFLRGWADSTGDPIPDVAHPIDLLATRFNLTADECDLILLAGLPEEHEGIASTFRRLHPAGEPSPSVGVAALLLGGTTEDRSGLRGLLSSGAASRHRILHVVGPGPLFERSLVLGDRVWEALHGYDAWPAGLPRVVVPPAPPGLAGWLDRPEVRRGVHALRADDRALIMISSAVEAVGLARCAALADAAGRRLVAARVSAGQAGDIAAIAVHAALRGAVPLVVVETPADAAAVTLDFGGVPGPVLLCAAPGSVRAASDRAVHGLSAGAIAVTDQRTAWAAAVPRLAASAATLAARHPLDPALTAQVAIDIGQAGDGLDVADISALIRTRAGVTLPAGVELLTPTVPWSHLVLPEEGGWQLRDAVARLDHQSVVLEDWGLRVVAHANRGARLLFSGPPGTGKSLAAHAVATAVGTDLLVIDIARVVSKWLGETEKNLAAAFDAAERTQAVLLLDEADALFGTRTEISDAHDRYANLETSYLLQRLDRFDGLAILTTNLRANIDGAFLRRLDFVVDFPLPDVTGRADLWTRHLPPAVLADDVDFDALARLYPVPGGWIRNAAVGAAFIAAAGGDVITQHHLVGAMRREYAKSAQPFPGEPARRRHDPLR